MSFTYNYPRPAVTTDAILFSRHLGEWHVLLIQRKHEPFKDCWAFPGGFLDENEDPDLGVIRELEEETSIRGVAMKPLGFWGRPGRDPRGHTVSLVYWTVVDGDRLDPKAADDASALQWHSLKALPDPAFDHSGILAYAMGQLYEASPTRRLVVLRFCLCLGLGIS